MLGFHLKRQILDPATNSVTPMALSALISWLPKKRSILSALQQDLSNQLDLALDRNILFLRWETQVCDLLNIQEM